ncbi:MAG: hypothetical protein R3F35_18790 [Myxococcota bacterium]
MPGILTEGGLRVVWVAISGAMAVGEGEPALAPSLRRGGAGKGGERARTKKTVILVA